MVVHFLLNDIFGNFAEIVDLASTRIWGLETVLEYQDFKFKTFLKTLLSYFWRVFQQQLAVAMVLSEYEHV